MDIFQKCYDYYVVDQAKAMGVYPLSRIKGQDNVVEIESVDHHAGSNGIWV